MKRKASINNSNNGTSKRVNWTKAQDNLLISLMEGNDINWTSIARMINKEYPDINRSGKQ